MQSLTNAQKKALLKRSHDLHPVVMIGDKGLTDAVHKEIDIALNAHELIKLKIAGSDRTARAALLDQITTQHQATLVQAIGLIGILYREHSDKT